MSDRSTNLAFLLAAIEAMPEDVKLVLESPKRLFDNAAPSTLFLQLSQQLAKQSESGEIERLTAHETTARLP